MSRFAANPKWLVYFATDDCLPARRHRTGLLLEHPSEAFTYFRNQGVPQVVCEEKHMGSRAVVVVCRDQETARDRLASPTRQALFTRALDGGFSTTQEIERQVPRGDFGRHFRQLVFGTSSKLRGPASIAN